MIRTLTFTDTADGRRRFKMLWDGFRIGTMTQKPEARTRGVMRQEAHIRKTLKTISTNGAVKTDTDARSLHRGGGSISLEQPLIKLLTAYGWSVQWTPAAVEDAIDALDFADASPEKRQDPSNASNTEFDTSKMSGMK